MNLNIGNLDIFPCSKNISKTNSSLFYEQNITNMIRQVTDVDSYVISGSVSSDGVVNEGGLALSLYGYYIFIKEGTSLIPEGVTENVYIGIELTEPSDTVPQELDGQVSGELFEPVILSGTDNVSHALHLLTKASGTWAIPTSSFVKFNIGSLFRIQDIDGKHDIIGI